MVTEQHFYSMPISKEELKKHCDTNSIRFKAYKFKKDGDFLWNACLSKKCPFYLKINGSLAQHLEGDRSRMPAFNKSIKILRDCNDEEKILNAFKLGACGEISKNAKNGRNRS